MCLPKPRKYELIRCAHFHWRLVPRDGVLYADGRSNRPNPGRHSLGTGDRAEALKALTKLDFQRALKLGLAEQSAAVTVISADMPLTLDDGWAAYKKHIERPRVVGGPKPSTQKRYRPVFDKFVPFVKARGTETWNNVTDDVIHSCTEHLEKKGYAPKTVRNEIVTILQAYKFLRRKYGETSLRGAEPLRIDVKPVESEKPYCYSTEEVAAMVQHCRANAKLVWLAHVIVGLATTGLRIAELAGLRWTDIDVAAGMLVLTDESGHASRDGRARRETKSSQSRRLPLHEDFAATLQGVPRSDAFIFHGPRGGRLKPDTVRQVLIRDVLKPLAERFPTAEGEKGFQDGRLHSFRHYFASTCAQNPEISEATTMEWLGHTDSEMTRHYFTLHDERSKQQMSGLDLLGAAGQRRAGVDRAANNQKEPPSRDSDPTIAT